MRNLPLIDETRLKDLLREQEEKDARRPVRPIEAVRISRDYGKTWTLVAICDECRAGIEPPVQRRREGVAGVRYCDWCGARNSMFEGNKMR